MIESGPISIFACLRLIPFFTVLLWPFRENTYFRHGRNALYFIMALLACFTIGNLVGPKMSGYEMYRYLYTGLGYLAGAALLKLCIPENLPKLAFVYFLGLRYMEDLSAYIWLISQNILQTAYFPNYYHNLIFSTIIVILISLPLMILFIDRLVVPLMANHEDSKFWKKRNCI